MQPQPFWLHEVTRQFSTNDRKILSTFIANPTLYPDVTDERERCRKILSNILVQKGKICVLDGKDATNLASNIHTFITPHGVRITSATDKGVDQLRNEDRIAINPFAEFGAVCDGMGGHPNGDLAAAILAHQLLRYPDDIDKAVEEARKKYKDRALHKDSGTCFASVQIIFEDEKKYVNIKQAGDVHVIIVNEDETLAFESKDETSAQRLVDSKQITPDQATYHDKRHIVHNAIHQKDGNVTDTCTRLPVFKGQKILILSDGISDNLTTLEILEIIKGLDGRLIIEKLSTILQGRMVNARQIIDSTANRSETGMFSDGFASEPKPDNRAIVVMEVP